MSDLPTRPSGKRQIKNLSWIEKVFGEDSARIVSVVILFLSVLIALMIYLAFETNEDEKIISGFISIMTILIGYFIGQKQQNSL